MYTIHKLSLILHNLKKNLYQEHTLKQFKLLQTARFIKKLNIFAKKMPYKKIVKTLPFQPQEIYDMVINVEQYPCFVPHCAEVNVHEASISRIIAEMIIEYHTVIKNFRISYISNVELYPENYTVLITNANDRFFKKLESSWKIKPCIEGSEITYEIAFELQNPVLNLTLSSLILKNSEIMIVAFTKRAFNLLKEIS